MNTFQSASFIDDNSVADGKYVLEADRELQLAEEDVWTTDRDAREKAAFNTLLIVDDDPSITEVLKKQIKRAGYEVIMAMDAEIGLSMLSNMPVGVILSDYVMPGMDGIDFLEKSGKIRPDAVQILMTGHATTEGAIDAINRLHIYGYLTKPWKQLELENLLYNAFQHYRMTIEHQRLQELARRQNLELKNNNETLEKRVSERTKMVNEALDEAIAMLCIAGEEKDDDTSEHIHRIKRLTEEMCSALGMSDRNAARIGLFSMLHDIGKMHVPDAILKKPGKLTCSEWEVMKRHSAMGERILGTKPFYGVARQIVRHHHENWDGSGYPDGLSGVEIPLVARIVAIADVFDALTSRRPYKEPWNIERSLEEIQRQKGKKFDPELVDLFIALQRKKTADIQRKAERKNQGRLAGAVFQNDLVLLSPAE